MINCVVAGTDRSMRKILRRLLEANSDRCNKDHIASLKRD
jgi:hypothetical protein